MLNGQPTERNTTTTEMHEYTINVKIAFKAPDNSTAVLQASDIMDRINNLAKEIVGTAIKSWYIEMNLVEGDS